MGTGQYNKPATPSSETSGYEDDDTEDEQYVSCLLEWLGLNLDCKRFLQNANNILVHHNKILMNKAISIF